MFFSWPLCGDHSSIVLSHLEKVMCFATGHPTLNILSIPYWWNYLSVSLQEKESNLCCRTARLRGLFITRLTPLITDPFRVVTNPQNLKSYYKTSKDNNLKLNKSIITAQTESWFIDGSYLKSKLQLTVSISVAFRTKYVSLRCQRHLARVNCGYTVELGR